MSRSAIAVTAVMALSVFCSWIQANAATVNDQHAMSSTSTGQRNELKTVTLPERGVMYIQQHCKFVKDVETRMSKMSSTQARIYGNQLDNIEATFASESVQNQKLNVCQEIQEIAMNL